MVSFNELEISVSTAYTKLDDEEENYKDLLERYNQFSAFKNTFRLKKRFTPIFLVKGYTLENVKFGKTPLTDNQKEIINNSIDIYNKIVKENNGISIFTFVLFCIITFIIAFSFKNSGLWFILQILLIILTSFIGQLILIAIRGRFRERLLNSTEQMNEEQGIRDSGIEFAVSIKRSSFGLLSIYYNIEFSVPSVYQENTINEIDIEPLDNIDHFKLKKIINNRSQITGFELKDGIPALESYRLFRKSNSTIIGYECNTNRIKPDLTEEQTRLVKFAIDNYNEIMSSYIITPLHYIGFFLIYLILLMVFLFAFYIKGLGFSSSVFLSILLSTFLMSLLVYTKIKLYLNSMELTTKRLNSSFDNQTNQISFHTSKYKGRSFLLNVVVSYQTEYSNITNSNSSHTPMNQLPTPKTFKFIKLNKTKLFLMLQPFCGNGSLF